MNKNKSKQSYRQSLQKIRFQANIQSIQQNRQILFQKIIENDIRTIENLNYYFNVQDLHFIDQFITPLVYCAYFGRIEMAKLLLNNKLIDIDLQTKQNKYTALAAACLGRNYQIIKLLIDFKAQINKPNSKHETPLTITLNNLIKYNTFQNRCICFKIVELLTSHGADVNWILDKQRGYTFLHILASRKEMNQSQKKLNYDIIKFLLSKGACLKLRGFDDKNAQELVLDHCNQKLLTELFENQKFVRSIKNKEYTNQEGIVKLEYYNKLLYKDYKTMNVQSQVNESEQNRFITNNKNIILDDLFFTQVNEQQKIQQE